MYIYMVSSNYSYLIRIIISLHTVNGFKHSDLILIIFKQIYTTLTGITTPGQSGSRSKVKKGVPHTHQSFRTVA